MSIISPHGYRGVCFAKATHLKETSSNISYMVSLAQKYIDIPELTAEIIREFISKIIVSEAEIVDGVRKQQVRIIYNGVGEVLLPGQSRILYSKE